MAIAFVPESLPVIIALVKADSIVAILGVSWGAVGSFFLGPFVWGLFSKKMNKFGAISSSTLGLIVCIGLFIIWGPKSSPQAGTIGMIVSLVVNPLFSYGFNLVKRNK